MGLFTQRGNKKIIGMVHVKALPGTPNYSGQTEAIYQLALSEAKLFEALKFDAIIIENMHDVPYLNRNVGPEVTATMAVIATKICDSIQIPCGIQILAGANKEALAVAHSANLNFIRAEGFVYSHVADEGLMDGHAGELLRYRKSIGADHVEIFTDVQKKHSSHAITNDLSISDHIKAAEFFLSDGIIITGSSTGETANIEDVKKAKEVSTKPVLIGSGVSDKNINEYWEYADGFIVGSSLKEENHWANPIDRKKAQLFIKEVMRLRK
ncbi:MAG: BtpA/SgcQ family protein [Candidatus Marinimicrobia bacterium]|nr:BtpA/SgcQ family protein [Candidatus Neomarinimicrobiota bacterium]